MNTKNKLQKSIYQVALLFLLFLLPLLINAQDNRFTVEKEARPVEFNRMIFGQFIEHFHRQIYGGIYDPGSPLSDKDGFRIDVIKAMRELQVPIVRWPGGCFVSSYHWLDGVGPDRKPVYDKAWQVEEPNTFGTIEFVKWCRLIGAEPFICTNAGTGTAEEMSDWVEYCNLNIGKYGRLRQTHGVTEPLNVKYWSVGNENYGPWEMGAKTVEEWGPFVRESAKLMLNTDPDIKLFAAATAGEEWTLPLLQAAGHLLHYVSIHGYWDNIHFVNNPASYIECMMRTDKPAESIAATIAILEKARLRDRVKIAFDEWNLRGWHHPGHGSAARMDIVARDKNDINATYTMADALFSACFLNSCIRNCRDVEIGGFSPIVNTRGALYVHPKGIVKRTTFHVLQQYAEKLEKNYLPASFNPERLVFGDMSTPVLDAIVTCNDTRTHFVIAVVNKHPEKTVTFSPDFSTLTGSIPNQVSATILSGSSPDDYNDVGFENRVVPLDKNIKVEKGKITLPPHSLTFININK